MEGMVELENHHFLIIEIEISEIIDSGFNHS
jgi:hypothetical protein